MKGARWGFVRLRCTTISFLALALSAVSLLVGCSTLNPRAVPPAERGEALVLGLPNARFFVDEPKAMAAEQQRALLREARHAGVGKGGELPTAYLLSLSGGGDNGAFGAGLMVGWTAHGDRPKFKLVTGVSTGSLIAPFAFLGPEYDDALTHVYTHIDPKRSSKSDLSPWRRWPRTRSPTRARCMSSSRVTSTKRCLRGSPRNMRRDGCC